MFRFIGLCLGTLVRLLRARRSLLLENLALRQQLAVRKRRHPRPRLDLLDKLFWVAVRRFWSGWQQSLIVVTPETVVRWHRAGFRLYWKLICKVSRPVGRQPTYRYTARVPRDRFLASEGEGMTWMRQPSRQGIALFSVRTEFWRSTTLTRNRSGKSGSLPTSNGYGTSHLRLCWSPLRTNCTTL